MTVESVDGVDVSIAVVDGRLIASSCAAAALAAGPGGMRSLRRCGRPVAAVAIAAVSKAMTCPLSRTITPSPSAAIRWRATMIPLVVAMSQNSPPTGWDTTTWAAASSGGTE